MKQTFWSELALADLDVIGSYIGQFDGLAAQRVVTMIRQATLRLADFPLSGTRVGGTRQRKLSVPRASYLVYYEVGEAISVLRVVHARRSRL